jgi:hypothetical protein
MAKHYVDEAKPVATPEAIRLKIEGLKADPYEDGTFILEGVTPLDWNPERLEELLADCGVSEDDRMYLNEVIYRRIQSHTLGVALAKRMTRVG